MQIQHPQAVVLKHTNVQIPVSVRPLKHLRRHRQRQRQAITLDPCDNSIPIPTRSIGGHGSLAGFKRDRKPEADPDLKLNLNSNLNSSLPSQQPQPAAGVKRRHHSAAAASSSFGGAAADDFPARKSRVDYNSSSKGSNKSSNKSSFGFKNSSNIPDLDRIVGAETSAFQKAESRYPDEMRERKRTADITHTTQAHTYTHTHTADWEVLYPENKQRVIPLSKFYDNGSQVSLKIRVFGATRNRLLLAWFKSCSQNPFVLPNIPKGIQDSQNFEEIRTSLCHKDADPLLRKWFMQEMKKGFTLRVLIRFGRRRFPCDLRFDDGGHLVTIPIGEAVRFVAAVRKFFEKAREMVVDTCDWEQLECDFYITLIDTGAFSANDELGFVIRDSNPNASHPDAHVHTTGGNETESPVPNTILCRTTFRIPMSETTSKKPNPDNGKRELQPTNSNSEDNISRPRSSSAPFNLLSEPGLNPSLTRVDRSNIMLHHTNSNTHPRTYDRDLDTGNRPSDRQQVQHHTTSVAFRPVASKQLLRASSARPVVSTKKQPSATRSTMQKSKSMLHLNR
mmetsp:Transcript_18451/g.33054  ORF Transcript_18451/g.33054 Transcript_18451/m.33054 type:complete len:563 (-) Transcript_18451:147-1835(-)